MDELATTDANRDPKLVEEPGARCDYPCTLCKACGEVLDGAIPREPRPTAIP